MEGIKRESFRLGAKGQSIYRNGEKGDGVCSICDQWTAELDHDGRCKEEDCKRRRLQRAVAMGKAAEVMIDNIRTIIFTDTCEPLPQALPTEDVTERKTGPVCQHCGSDYKRPGDYLCVRCRRAAGPPKVMPKAKKFGRRR